MLKRTLIFGLLLALLVNLSWSADAKNSTSGESVDKAPVAKTAIPFSVNETIQPEAAQPADADATYKVPWTSVNAGGSTTALSTNYRMKASVGQSAIGSSTSANRKMKAGFMYGADGLGCTSLAGDASGNNTFALNDAVAIINYAFNKTTCSPHPLCWVGIVCRGDWSGNGAVALNDAIQAVNFVFAKPCGMGTPPCCWKPVKTGVCCQNLPAPCGP